MTAGQLVAARKSTTAATRCAKRTRASSTRRKTRSKA
jgi:hypothetical protein